MKKIIKSSFKKVFTASLVMSFVFGGGLIAPQVVYADADETLMGAKTVSAGISHTMVIDYDGVLWGFVNNESGRLGRGTTTHRHSPVRIMDDVAYVSAGGSRTMAITSDGVLWGWGWNGNGQLGDGTRINRHSPVRIMDNVSWVSAGMIITNDGILRRFSAAGRQGFEHIMANVAYVSAGSHHVMAITNDGVLWGWGDNRSGQIGDGTTIQRHSPVRIMDNVAAVSAGGIHTMAITNDGVLWRWGTTYGSFSVVRAYGVPRSLRSLTPVRVMDNVAYVSTGWRHTMAITNDGVLWGWGDNRFGNLGDGTTTPSRIPVRIMDNVASVSAGSNHTIAITNDGALWGWGHNNFGQLGLGTTTNHYSPVRITDGRPYEPD